MGDQERSLPSLFPVMQFRNLPPSKEHGARASSRGRRPPRQPLLPSAACVIRSVAFKL